MRLYAIQLLSFGYLKVLLCRKEFMIEITKKTSPPHFFT